MEQTASTEETLAALAAGSNVLAAAGGFVPSGADALELASTENAAAGLNDRSLESTAVNATFWTVLDYGASTCLRVVSSLWLTRLLLPAAFGEAGLVMTLIIGVTLLSDVGLAPSVIQNRARRRARISQHNLDHPGNPRRRTLGHRSAAGLPGSRLLSRPTPAARAAGTGAHHRAERL